MIALPLLIDPHVHFRIPGASHKEDWKSAAMACLSSGIGTVCDMPNNTPACVTNAALQEKKAMIDALLEEAGLPLRYALYLGADRNHLEEIDTTSAPAIKVFMGSSTGSLLIDDDKTLEEVFRRAKGRLIAVHAEDETTLRKCSFPSRNPADHSRMRPPEAAAIAIQKALLLTEKYNNPLYVLHVSTQKELALLRKAKARGLPVSVEATPHHLFLTEAHYASEGNYVKVNPPLRSQQDQEALWEAIADGTIDTIGSDHAPHTRAEKEGENPPSGVPGVETLLPLMLHAVNEGKLTLERLVELTHDNPRKLFGFPATEDKVIVDLQLVQEVRNELLFTKCGWSPFQGKKLQGWPLYTICGNKRFSRQILAEKRESSSDMFAQGGRHAR